MLLVELLVIAAQCLAGLGLVSVTIIEASK